MSFLLLHADQVATLLAESPIVAAENVPPLREAQALLADAERTRAAAAESAAAARAAAEAEGRAAGFAEGRAAGEAEWQAELFRLAARDSERSRARQAEVAALALEVVRHVAGALGPAEMVGALAAKAAAALAPEEVATLRVPPAALDTVRARLGDRAGLAIEADATLPEQDCVLTTALGSAHAGLDTQLAQVERAWAQPGAR